MAFDVGSLLSSVVGIFGNSSAKKNINQATGYQVAGANEAANQFKAEAERSRGQFQPFYDVGFNAVQQLHNAVGGNGQEGKDWVLKNFRDFNPGYQFAMDQGIQARDRSAAARGSLDSGGYAKELTQFRQGLADQNYNSYLDRLQGLANQGQQAAAQSGALGAAAAGGMADAWMYRGDSRAAGEIAKNNANTSLINGFGQMFGNNSGGLNKLFGFGG